MTQINEEDKKAEILKEFEQYCNQCDYFNHRIWAYEKMKSLMDKAFAYSDAEVERLRKENDIATGNALAYSEAHSKLLSELSVLRKQNEEMTNLLKAVHNTFTGGESGVIQYLPRGESIYEPDWVKKLATYITDKQL